MAKASLLSIPVEIRDLILEYATVKVLTNSPGLPDIWRNDDKTTRSLASTCRAFADELFHFHIPSDGLIYVLGIHIARCKDTSDCWLSLFLTSSMPSFCYKFYIRDLNDPKLRSLVQKAARIDVVMVDIEVPDLQAVGRSESEGTAVLWSKPLEQSCFPNSWENSRPVLDQKSVSTARMMPLRPHFECRSVNSFWSESSFGYGYAINDEDNCLDDEFDHNALRISKTAEEGICRPLSLSKRALKSLPRDGDYAALTEDEVLGLRHEMRTLSIAVDTVIDTCRGSAANMLRLHRFATWDSPETDGMSVAAQHNLLRGAGPQDRTISNRETLMQIMKPADCDTSSYPVDTWYDKYPEGIEPLDILAKRHRECFEEEPNFQEHDITHSKD
ncbi:hypothetical protein PG984_005688 [Apiospora sp. TS-2023a]